MNPINVVFLGIVQGLAEFLPISSSGHLVILQSLMPSFSQPGVLFDVILHFGTVLSVIFFFRKKIFSYCNLRYLSLLVIGTLPAVVVGLLFKDQLEGMFGSVKLVGVALLTTGIINLITDKMRTKNLTINAKNAFVTGIAQAVAIIPGISRSGSTIFASVAQGIDRKAAAEFSFILSIPAVLGANLLEMISNRQGLTGIYPEYVFGFFISFITGVVAIGFVFRIITTKRYKYFAYYCFALGVLALMFL